MKNIVVKVAFILLACLSADYAMAACRTEQSGDTVKCGGANAAGYASGWHINLSKTGEVRYVSALAMGPVVRSISLAKWKVDWKAQPK